MNAAMETEAKAQIIGGGALTGGVSLDRAGPNAASNQAQENELSGLVTGFRGRNEVAWGLINRLDGIVDRLGGSIPAEADDQSEPPSPSGLNNQIRSELGAYSNLTDRAQALIDRLDGLV